MGHASLKTTQKYLHLNVDDLHKEYFRLYNKKALKLECFFYTIIANRRINAAKIHERISITYAVYETRLMNFSSK